MARTASPRRLFEFRPEDRGNEICGKHIPGRGSSRCETDESGGQGKGAVVMSGEE